MDRGVSGAQGAVNEAVFFAAANQLNQDVDLILFDTTSKYFERDGEDEPGEDEAGARKKHR